ncbi:MAG: hypothetical protein AMXMBFR34_38220 [Myxococcaceae bacterium]
MTSHAAEEPVSPAAVEGGMAGGMDLGGSGKGKRPLDTTINLVPPDGGDHRLPHHDGGVDAAGPAGRLAGRHGA